MQKSNSTIFTTKNNQLAVFGKTVDDIRGKLIDFENIWIQGGRYSSNKPQIIPEENLIRDLPFDEAKKMLDSFNKSVVNGSLSLEQYFKRYPQYEKSLKTYVTTAEQQSQSVQGLMKATQEARQKQLDHNEALKQQTLGAKAAALGIKALNVATSIGIALLVNLGISLLQAGWEKIQEALKSTDEKIKDLTQDLNSSLQEVQSISKEFQNLKSSADEVIPRFAELSNGVDEFGKNISLTDEEYQEFLDLNNKIADMFPELNLGLDSNGNAMLALSGNADTLTESLYALVEVQRQAANQKIADEFGETFETAKKTANAYSTKREEIKSDINPFNNLRYIIDNPDTWGNEIIAESGQQISYLDYAVEKLEYLFSIKNKKDQLNELKKKYTGNNGGIWWEFLFKDQQVQSLINNTINGYEKQLHDVEVKVQSIWTRLSSSISAVLEHNPLYQSLDDELRNMAKIISAGVDPSQFDDDSALIDYIETNIISPLANLPKEVQKSISQIPDLQKQLKDGLISKEAFADKIKNVFAEIQDQTSQEQFNAFINAFVSGYNQMGIEGDNFIDVLKNLILYYIDCANVGKTAESATKSFTEVISNVQSLSKGLDKLASIYKNIQNQDDFDWSSILNNKDFQEQFENCGVVYTDFIKAISNSTTDIDSCQEAFNNLVTEYIYGNGILDDLTEETKSATIAMLEQMGVVNAAEVVEKNLYSQKEKNTKRFCGVLKQMAEAYPEIQSAADDYLSGLINEEQLIAQLSDEYATDKDNHYQYLLTKLNNEEEFIRASSEGSAAIVDYFSENYGVDLTNYKSYIGRKKALQADFDSSVAGGLSKYFNADGSVTAEFLALTDQAKSGIQSIYEQYQNAIQDLNSLYEPVDFQFHVDFDDDSSSNLYNSATDTSKTFNWIERAIEKVQKAFSKLGNIASNAYKALTTRNNALAGQIKTIRNEIELQQTAYAAYMAKANSVRLPSDLKEKVQNGAIDIGDYDSDTAEIIDEYKEWYDKAQDCKDAIDELHQSLADLYKDRFDNIQKDFDNKLSEIEHKSNVYNIGIDTAEAKGYLQSVKYYAALQDAQKSSLSVLNKELSSLQTAFSEAMKSGEIEEYSEGWYELKSNINDVSEEILKANQTLAEYAKTMREIEWDHFDYLQERISDITTEANFLLDIIGDNKLLDGKGNYTDKGFSYLGLHAQNYNVLMAQADKYAEEIAAIERQIANDPYNDDLLERKRELLELQQDTIKSAEDEKQAMLDLAKEGIQEQIDALKELIDTYKKALDEAKDLHDYQRKIADHTSEISKLQKQLEAYKNDNSEEAKATVQKLELQLKEAKEDLQETKYDRYISEQNKLLDELYTEYEDFMNERMDNIESEFGDLIQSVNENSSVISDVIKTAADDVGYILSDSMSSIWDNVANGIKNIVSVYGDQFTDKLTTVNDTLKNIGISVNALVAATDGNANSNVSSAGSNSTSLSTGGGNINTNTNTGTGGNTGNKGNNRNGSSTGKTIAVGGKIYAGNAPIYGYAGAPASEGEKQAFAHDPIYTVLKELNNYLLVRWHKADSGYSGWFKKSDVMAYKNGGLVNYTGLAQLDGTPSKPEYVLNSEQTKNFLELNEMLKDINVKKLIGLNTVMPALNKLVDIEGVMSDMKAMQNADFSTNMRDINISIDHVADYNDFVKQVKNDLTNDRKFEKMIQSITIDRAVGKNSLSKNNFKW